VLLPQRGIKIASILASLKLFVARRAIAWLKEHAADYLTHLEDCSNDDKRRFRFWHRGGGYDRNLRSTRDVHEKIAYVHHNPVKRSLVAQPEQWNWSSARAWASGSDEPLRLDRQSVPTLTSNEDSGRSGLLD
jgi:putative transposase